MVVILLAPDDGKFGRMVMGSCVGNGGQKAGLVNITGVIPMLRLCDSETGDPL